MIENDSKIRKQNKILFLLNLNSSQKKKYFLCKKCGCYLQLNYHSILISQLLPTIYVSNPFENGCTFCFNTPNDMNKSFQILRIQQYREHLALKKYPGSFHDVLVVVNKMFPDEIYIKKIDNKHIENYKHDPVDVNRPLLLEIFNEDDIPVHRLYIHNILSHKELSDHGL